MLCKPGFLLQFGTQICLNSEENCDQIGLSTHSFNILSNQGLHTLREYVLSIGPNKVLTGCDTCANGFVLMSPNLSLTSNNQPSTEIYCINSNVLDPSNTLSTLASSVPNCQELLLGTQAHCGTCQANYILDKTTFQCHLQTSFENCDLVHDNPPKCLKCSDNYTLTTANICASNENCLITFNEINNEISKFPNDPPSDLNTCFVCKFGFQPDNNNLYNCKTLQTPSSENQLICRQFDFFKRCVKCQTNQTPINYFRESDKTFFKHICAAASQSHAQLPTHHITISLKPDHTTTASSSPSPSSLTHILKQAQPGAVPSQSHISLLQTCQPSVSILNCQTHSKFGCSQCLPGFYYDPSTISCLQGNIHHCLLFTDTNTCNQCKQGFYLESTTSCKARNIISCAEFETSLDKCSKCPNQTIQNSLTNDACQPHPALGCLETNPQHASCLSCKDNFEFDFGSGNCLSISVSGCLQHHAGTRFCMLCDTKSYLDLATNTCLKFNAPNCTVPDAFSNICLQCKENYFLSTSNTCQASKHSNCLQMAPFADICQQCRPQYTLLNGRCFSSHDATQIHQCAEFDFSNDSCARCDTGFYLLNKPTNTLNNINPDAQLAFQCVPRLQNQICKLFSPISPHCQQCQPNMQLSESTQLCIVYNDPNCEIVSSDKFECFKCHHDYYFQPTGAAKCVKHSIAHCAEYQTNSNICKQCVNKYFLYTPQSNNNSNSISSPFCLPYTPVLNCETYSSNTDGCSSCAKGHYLSANSCSPSPDGLPYCRQLDHEQNLLSTNFKKCKVCSRDYFLNSESQCIEAPNKYSNCQIYQFKSDVPHCQQCNLGFYLSVDRKTCAKPEVPNCQTFESISSCTKCQPGFEKTTSKLNNIICSKIQIQFCLEIKQATQHICVKCDANRFWNANTAACQTVQTSVPNCSEYSSSINCKKCQPPYALNLENNSCQMASPFDKGFCEDANITGWGKPQCAVCDAGYFRNVEGVCIQCATENCMFCDYNNSKCRVCASNFYMDNTGKCLPVLETDTGTNVTGAGSKRKLGLVFWMIAIIGLISV